MIRISLTLLLMTFSATLCGQTALMKRCGTTTYYEQRLGKAGYAQYKQNLNAWLQRAVAEDRTKRTVGSTTSIAVVVHILHQGQAVGVSPNLSAAQVRSQIIVLNEDYNRLNPDTLKTPSYFRGVAAAVGIHFGLATINPANEVMAEPGINRIKVEKERYTPREIDQIMAKHIWNPDKYLNIFVTKIDDGEGSETFAYAYFPNNSTLTGISPTNNSFGLVDGAVVSPEAFGSNYTKEGSSFKLHSGLDRGRTVTHEVGHYLGLFHVWGESGAGCSSDDFVADTPLAARSHSNYNRCNIPLNTCLETGIELPDMFQNYMDYTSDICMNLFTEGQKERMLTALKKADHRRNLDIYYSLLTGDKPVDPTALPTPSLESTEDLAFYPNPTTGEFKLKVDNSSTGTYELKITNSRGQIVFKNNFVKQVQNYTYTGNVSHLANGLYLITLKSKDYHRTLKFIIAK